MNILDFRFPIQAFGNLCVRGDQSKNRGMGDSLHRDLKPKIRNRKSKIICVFLMSCVLYFGCESDEEEGRISMPEDDVRSGWEEYNSGNYGSAILAFEKALTEDGPHSADAYNGLGWVYLSFSRSAGVNQKNLAMSLSKFQEAITRDRINADAWVGQAGLLLAVRGSQDDLRDALKSVGNALQGDASYLYRHDYDSEADLYALKAQCYYYLGELDKAQDEIKRALAIEKNNGVALTMRRLLE